ncbi:hypothetical protein JCM1393_06280 [Clostridium carnis]
MRFVTFFPELKSFHLKKDVGLIPILLKKYKGYDVKIVTYKNEEVYDYDKNSIDLEFIKKKYGVIIDFSLYLIKNARKIDVLNLYHITSIRNFRWIMLYKILNNKGKVFLKLDADNNIKLYDFNKNSIKQKLKNYILKKVDLITVENYTIKDYIEKEWKIDVKFLPNGFYDNDEVSTDFGNKSNIILTVGRIGTYQKATDILLEAFAKCNDKIENWKLIIVGDIDNEFKKYLNEYNSKYKNLLNKI